MQTTPAAVASIDAGTRPLPPSPNFVVGKTASAQVADNPLGRNPVQNVRNSIPMSPGPAQQLYPYALSPHFVPAPAPGPASPGPPGAVLPTSPSPYTSPTGIMSISPANQQVYQQAQRPTLAQAPVAYAGQTPVQMQPMSATTPINTEVLPRPQLFSKSFFGVPKNATLPPVVNHAAAMPTVPYSPAPGSLALLPPQNPNFGTPQPTTSEPLTTRRAYAKALKKVGKAALNIMTTSVPIRAIVQSTMSTEASSALGNIFSSSDVLNSLGVSQADLQAVLTGTQNANYAVVIQALMRQQQLQQQGAAVAASSAINYAALIAELQRIEAQKSAQARPLAQVGVPGQAGLAGHGIPGQAGYVGQGMPGYLGSTVQGIPGQVGLSGQMIPGQIGSAGLNSQVQANNVLLRPQQNTYNTQVVAVGGQQPQGNAQTLVMQHAMQAQALVPSQQHIQLNQPQQPATGHLVLSKPPQLQLSQVNQVYQTQYPSPPVTGAQVNQAQSQYPSSSIAGAQVNLAQYPSPTIPTQSPGVPGQHFTSPAYAVTQTTSKPLTPMLHSTSTSPQLYPLSTPPADGSQSHLPSYSPSSTQHSQSPVPSQHTHTLSPSSLSPLHPQFQVQAQAHVQAHTPSASSFSPSDLQSHVYNQALGYTNSTGLSGSGSGVEEALASSLVPTPPLSPSLLSKVQVHRQGQAIHNHLSQSAASTVLASTSAPVSMLGTSSSPAVSSSMAGTATVAIQCPSNTGYTQSQLQSANAIVKQPTVSQDALHTMLTGQSSPSVLSVQSTQPLSPLVNVQPLIEHSVGSAVQNQPVIAAANATQKSITFVQPTQPLSLSVMPTTQTPLLPAKVNAQSPTILHGQSQHHATNVNISSKPSGYPQVFNAALNQHGKITSSQTTLQVTEPDSLLHLPSGHSTSLTVSPATVSSPMPYTKPTLSQLTPYSCYTSANMLVKPQQMQNNLYQQQQVASVGGFAQGYDSASTAHQQHQQQGTSHQHPPALAEDLVQTPSDGAVVDQQQSSGNTSTAQADDQQQADLSESVLSIFKIYGEYQQQQEQDSIDNNEEQDANDYSQCDALIAYQQQQQDFSTMTQMNNVSASGDQSFLGQLDASMAYQQQQDLSAFNQGYNQQISALAEDPSSSPFDALVAYQQQQKAELQAALEHQDQIALLQQQQDQIAQLSLPQQQQLMFDNSFDMTSLSLSLPDTGCYN